MSPLAIPATPPPSTPNTEVPGAAVPHAQRFDDTLKQARPSVESRDGGYGGDAHKNPRTKQRDDDTSSDDNNAASGTPAAMIAPAPAHQPVVAGKTSPNTEDAAANAIASVAAQDVAVSAAAQPGPRGAANTTPVLFKLPLTAQPVHVSAPLVPLKGIPGTAPTSSASTDAAAPSDAASGEPNASPDATSFDANLRTLLQTAAQDRNARTDDKDSGLAANAQTNDLLAHLAQLAAGTHAGATATQTPPPIQLTMQSTPGQPQFAQEAAQQVAWLAGQDIQRAEIQLNPRKLGPIQVEITTHHDRVDVSFAVQHPQTVHALQQTLPQLTDMLAQQGLNLGNASVGQQAGGQQHPAFAQHAEGGHAAGSLRSVEPESATGWRTLRVATPGGVDDFA